MPAPRPKPKEQKPEIPLPPIKKIKINPQGPLSGILKRNKALEDSISLDE
jgi:hypothetical protein